MNKSIQSILFRKDKWSERNAFKWLEDHNYSTNKIDRRGNFYRFRQISPSEFDKYRTKRTPEGIDFIFGYKENVEDVEDPKHIVEGGKFDLHKHLPKIPLNPPGFNYLGPNNPLDKQVDLETGVPNPGHEPTNALDTIALKHDLLYHLAETEGSNEEDVLRRKHLADEIFVKEAEQTEGKTWKEKFWNWLSRNIIKGKMKLGLGLTEEHIKSRIHELKTKNNIRKYLHENVYIF